MARLAGYWEGSYFAGGEGNLRTPCIVRWPGHIEPGQTSDEIMHVTDWFTTILRAAGLSEPDDRVIDGVNQLGWLTGQTASQREGYIYWMGPQMYGVKWHNFKLVLVAQTYMQDAAAAAAHPPHYQPGYRPAGTRDSQPALPAHVDGDCE